VCVFGYGLLLVGRLELVLGNCERSTCVWKLPDCKNESSCPRNIETGRAHVFGDFLTARM
jgi:hypothetical protein